MPELCIYPRIYVLNLNMVMYEKGIGGIAFRSSFCLAHLSALRVLALINGLKLQKMMPDMAASISTESTSIWCV
ncbi:hypothetical protein J4727_03625 [Providencia rettgeri]|uniref:Uncharacterized protein n=1 Tax=Providencia rettgeri TaxID=587 RepID=A0A939NFP6_PRORE|nr:hypothetical protein [Providencia rettgeri]